MVLGQQGGVEEWQAAVSLRLLGSGITVTKQLPRNGLHGNHSVASWIGRIGYTDIRRIGFNWKDL